MAKTIGGDRVDEDDSKEDDKGPKEGDDITTDEDEDEDEKISWAEAARLRKGVTQS